MRSTLRSLLFIATFVGAISSAQGALISANFNDTTTGTTLNTQGGGSGFSGNWSGSSNVIVEPGNLTSTLYNKPQTGTSLRVRGNNDVSVGIRQMFRAPATPLQNEVWFSYLVRLPASTDRAGLSFNAPTASPFADRGNVFMDFQASGTNVNLVYRFGHGTDQSISSIVTGLNTTILVVGQMTLTGSGGLDGIKLWINPDLIANPDINAYTPNIDSSALNYADSITGLGIIAYRNGGTTSSGGQFDNLFVSDTATAFSDVTGVPEPGAAMLLGVTTLGLALLRRRRVA